MARKKLSAKQSKSNEALYTIDEIVASGRFPYAKGLQKIALTRTGKDEFTLGEAEEYVSDFANTEVL